MAVGRTDVQVEALILRLGGVTTPGRFMATRLCAAVRDPPGVQTTARLEMLTHRGGTTVDDDGVVWIENHGTI